MHLRARTLALLVTGAITPALTAQDSTDVTTCGAGDALTPWADTASGVFGQEQDNDFVVDLRNFKTSWGTGFGIAPLIKSSKSGSAFNTSVISSQAISKLQKAGVSIAAGSYDLWDGPGIGVNNDPTKNSAPTKSRTTSRQTQQFAVAFSEFGTTDTLDSYNGVIGAIVNYRPETPGRMYVSRNVAALNGCSFFTNVSQYGLGSVDEEGNVFFRADGAGVVGGCGLTPMAFNHLFAVQMALRTPGLQNVLSNDVIGLRDIPAVDEFISNNGDVHVTPNNLPPKVSGGGPFVLSTNFGGDFVRGSIVGGVASVADHLAAPITDTRGSVGYTQDDFASLFSSAGIAAILGKDDPSNITEYINLFGLDATGGVTGAMSLKLPASLVDNSTGAATVLPNGTLEYNNYASQVPFRGGTGQVALGVDQNGDLLVAATGDHPSGDNANPINMIAVAKVPSGGGAASWTMAAYNDGTFGAGGTGKPILDGPGGSIIGRLVPLLAVTGGAPAGPSMSSPMMDSVGNIYFMSAIEIFDPADFAVGLIRGVYDQATFSWELDLVVKTGDIHRGVNSDRDYLITFIQIADSNSVSSGSAFSGNIQEVAAGDMDTADLDGNADARALGGLVMSAGLIYDTNDDGDFTTCFNLGVDDNNYNMLLYIGHNKWPEIPDTALAGSNGTPKLEISGVLDPIDPTPIDFRLSNMLPGTTLFLVLGFTQINAPFKCGTLVPNLDLLLTLPTLGGELEFGFNWPGGGIPPNFPMTWQAWIPDVGAICGFASTNAVETTTP